MNVGGAGGTPLAGFTHAQLQQLASQLGGNPQLANLAVNGLQPTLTPQPQPPTQTTSAMPSAVTTPAVQQTVVAPNAAMAHAQPVPSLPWPLLNPVINVPHFDVVTYRNVNMEAQPSHDPSGMDLPLTDITTIRFFFNLGVQQARNMAAHRFPEPLNPLAAPQNQLLSIAYAGGAQNYDQLTQILNTQAMIRQAQVQAQAQAVQAHAAAAATQQQAQQAQQAQAQQAQVAHQQHLNRLAVAQQHQHMQQAIAQQRQAAEQQAHQQAHQQAQQQAQQQANAAQQAQQAHHANPLGIARLPGHPDFAAFAASNALAVTSAAVNQLVGGNHGVGASSSASQVVPGGPGKPGPNYEDQAMLLQRALLNATVANTQANAKPSLYEIRLQALATQQQQQQQPQAPNPNGSRTMNIHPYLRPAENLKPPAANGDAPVSPRAPIVMSTSPVPAPSGGEGPRLQAADQPSTSSSNEEEQRAVPEIAIDANSAIVPVAAAGPSSSQAVSSSVNSGIPSLFQMSEDHFTETFLKKAMKRQEGEPAKQASPKPREPEKEEDDSEDDKPALAPILMMSYLRTCIGNAKTQLNASGVQVGVDDNGMLVDFSSRPVDPIFKEAREELARNRDFRQDHNRSSPKRPPLPGQALGPANSAPAAGVSTSTPSPCQPVVGSPGSTKSESPSTRGFAPIAQNPLGINRAMIDATTPTKRPNPDSSSSTPVRVEDDEDEASSQKKLKIDE
ncbi:unnamed protein product [Caenorhabditis auriculariae]|uniref:Uncharacterized protein n=1 Tax=Caenorhabditis auriculariae TaxID=2777116 RepID=A0A8S1H1Y8_9PELO|nr:unnamed protein product [Caenorhabditis auriculariae]